MNAIVQRLRKLDQLRLEKVPQLLEANRQYAEEYSLYTAAMANYKDFERFVEAAPEIEAEYQKLIDLKRDIARVLDQKVSTLNRYTELSMDAAREQKALAFYSSVLDDITAEYVSKLEDALNQVYTYVFQNPNKRVSLDLVDRYNKKVLVLRVINLSEGTDNVEDLDDSGFSVSVVLGTVLLVYFILYNNLERIIFFDESFGGLADDTLGRFFALLRVFIEDLGFKFMLISHEPRHKEYADRIYSVRGGRFTEEKGDVEEEVPVEEKA